MATPLYNFFIKKYRTGLSDVWWVCSKTFYFETFSAPTADTLFLLVLSILTLESVHSIRFLYQHFLSGITTKSLNTFYHACSYAKVDYSHFMNITAKVLGAMLVCTIIWYRTQYMNYIILGIAEFMLVGVLAAGAFVLALVSEVRDCVGRFIIGGWDDGRII